MTGVRAYARCCKVAGLTCDYRTAGPSLSFDGAMAEARCADGQKALGKAIFFFHGALHPQKPSGFLGTGVQGRPLDFHTGPEH